MRTLFIILSFLTCSNFAIAQDWQINSDRLNFSASSQLVKKGGYQIESGYFLAKTTNTFFNTYYAQLPSVRQRYGLSDRIELRLNVISAAVFSKNNSSAILNYYLSGLEGPQLGAKIKILKQKKLLPNISIMPEVQIQSLASPQFNRKNIRPSLQVLMSHELPAHITLGYNIGSTWDQKFYYGYDVYLQKKWGQKIITNINYVDQWFAPDETGPNKQKRICTNIGYYFTDKIIADFGLGWGIHDAPNNFYKVGVSFGLR